MKLCQRVLDEKECQRNGRRVWYYQTLKEKRCDELWSIQRNQVTGTHYKDCGKSALEANKDVDKPGRYAIRIYARKGDDGCFVNLMKDARGISW